MKLHIKIVFLLVLFSCGKTVLLSQVRHPLIWDVTAWTKKEIIALANQYVGQPSIVVTEKHAISGNAHNYESFGIYFWPDPLSPDSPYVYRDGQRNPELKKYDGEKLNNFVRRIRTLSLAYYFTGDDKFRLQWNQDMSAWFLDKSTKMLPNFQYAQFRKNSNGNRGNYYGIIEAYVMIDIVESIYLMRSLNGISKQMDHKIKKWFRQFAKWLRTSYFGVQQSQAPNNLSVAYDVMMCCFYIYIEDYNRLQQIVAEFANKRLEKQIMPNGPQPLEMKRAKPMSYSIYNLRHIFDLCLMLQSIGDDYYLSHKQIIDSAYFFIKLNLVNKNALNDAEKIDYVSLTKQFMDLERTYKRLNKQIEP